LEGPFIVEELQEKTVALDEEDVTETNLVGLIQRRDRHDIIAEILKTARDGRKKTSIMYKARLSHSQLKLYLKLLNRSNMIICDNGVYRTTPKGLTFVREFESMNFLFRQ
jgi:predicted transcriptional regulator